MYTLTKTNSDPDFQSLIKLLDQDLLAIYGEQQSFFDQFNKTNAIKHVVVLYADSEPIACGAIKQYDAHAMEVKRMFVKQQYRGQKLGLKVLQAVEQWAADLGYTHCVLETGKSQPEAIKLYQNNGYQIIDNYGPYIGVENSLCMRKEVG